MATATTAQLKAANADFGNTHHEWSAFASLGNKEFVRCHHAGESVWEQSTELNPVCNWTFTRADGNFHARIKTSLNEALRIAADWNNDCPSRAIETISNGSISKIVPIQLSLIAS